MKYFVYRKQVRLAAGVQILLFVAKDANNKTIATARTLPKLVSKVAEIDSAAVPLSLAA